MSKKAFKIWDQFQKPGPIKFETNGFYEHMMEVRRKQPKVFEGLLPATKLALAEYEKQKRQAAVDAEAAA